MSLIWFSLILILTAALMYIVIARQVKKLTRTPVWQLWLVLMAPIVCLVLWRILSGGRMLPPFVFLFLLIVSFFFYASLIERGRIQRSIDPDTKPDSTDEPLAPRAPDTDADPAAALKKDASSAQSIPEPTTSEPVQVPSKEVVRPLTDEEEKRLRDCFPWSTYYVQNFEYRPQAVICWGQLRAPAEMAYKKITANVRAEFGDRFLVLLQEGQKRKPIFAIVTNPQVTPEGQILQKTLDKPSWGIALALLSFVTTTWAGYEIVKVLPDALKSGSPNIWDGLPYACAWMGFFGVRELGYYLTARRYRVPVTLPYFIPLPPLPSLPIGTLGAFIQLRSPVPNRQVLFDIRAVGSLFGLFVAIILLAVGLTQSTVVDVVKDATPSIFDFEGLRPQFSLMLACLSKWALGGQLTADKLIALHPIAFAGWLGVLFSAFNLMPIGSLDGGRIVHAVYGQRVGAIIGNVARWLLLALAMTQSHLLLWALLLFLLPTMDEPALNDVTELNGWRDFTGLVMLAVLLLIIMPAPASLMAWLGLA
ncbi:site-2 protease family protein [filamentous cyanobacterium LEGE 11480]|uniref:Site-2 protease family protein n=1 Tax=Romeriopsis navalis LEGE 11480 TaxID=2777977 RepID=A0A928Z427_9CYAN|nr:site-2 protease family protein [Romeriopsis navalis]MBE9031309.1 site-2 protease family protein [Romeriopsis navalis LEGE 11480]